MQNIDIKPGDRVTLSWTNGLGRGVFKVLKVYPSDPIHGLLVEGMNGELWPARREGAVKVGCQGRLKKFTIPT